MRNFYECRISTQGRKHTIALVLVIVISARLAGIGTGIGVAQFARVLNQTQFNALGAWFNLRTEK